MEEDYNSEDVYNVEDGWVGHWFINKPYYPPIKPFPEGNRVYIMDDSMEDIPTFYSKRISSPEIRRYFDSVRISKGELPQRQPHMNGRRIYAEPKNFNRNEKYRIARTTEKQISICRELSPFNEVQINMATLICSQFRTDKRSWPELIDAISKCDVNSECYECTSIGFRIAKSLIKIASLRIFAEPEQSILELLVNSIDSYHPESRVGKFGMGFFSILYWIIGHPKRKLHIYSWFHEEGKGYCGYHATIYDTDGGLFLNLKILETSVETTGTYIHIDAKEDEFSRRKIINFKRQLKKLTFVRNVKIGGLSFRKLFLFERGSSSEEHIFVNLNSQYIYVEDYAQGIPINVLLGSLFVPSISTKTIRQSVKSSNKWTKEESREDKMFIILVNKIGVVRIKYTKKKSFGILIDMPPTTRLPVSRDDIILDDNTREYFKRQIIDNLEESFKLKSVKNAEKAFNLYLNYTANEEIKTIIRETLYEFHIKYNRVLVDKETYNALNGIWGACVKSNYMDRRVIEDEIAKSLKHQDDIWAEKMVIFGKITENIATYGFTNLVFVNENYTDQIDWIINAALAYRSLGLIPQKTDYGDAITQYYKSLIGPDDLKDNKIIFSLVATYMGLDVCRTLNHAEFKKFLWSLIYFFELEQIEIIAQALVSKFGKLEGNQTYGGDKYKFEIVNLPDNQQIKGFSPNEKLNKFRLEAILYSIEALDVQDKTFIPFGLFFPDTDSYIRRYGSRPVVESIIYYSDNIITFGITKIILDNLNLEDAIMVLPLMIKKIKNLNISEEEFIGIIKWMNAGITKQFLLQLSDEAEALVKILSSRKIGNPIEITTEENSEETLLLSKLLGYLFVNEPSKNISDTFTEAINFEGETPLQLIEIAINEGTTRDFIPAVLTELAQNSVDAIRLTNNKNKNIEIWFSNVGRRFEMSVTDYVGIPPEGVLSLSIPFLSTKTPSELVTGEMGSGFFNVYRESELVEIYTIKDGILTYILDKPVWENGRVIDVKRTFKQSLTQSDNITNIKIISRELTIPTLSEYIGTATYYSNRVLSQIGAFDDIVVKVNGISDNFKLEYVLSSGNFSIYTHDYNYPSYVLTKGIPYSPLDNYLTSFTTDVRRAMSTGIIINIESGGYTPVQSRTKINMPKKDLKMFNALVRYSIFIKVLEEFGKTTFRANYYINYNSVADTSQIFFGTNPQKELSKSAFRYFFLYTPIETWNGSEDRNGNNIAAITNQVIAKLGKRNPRAPAVKEEIRNFIGGLDLTDFPFIKNKISEYVMSWIMTKNKHVQSEQDFFKRIEEPDQSDKELESYIVIWIRTFVDIAIKNKITGWNRHTLKEILVLKRVNSSNLGWFTMKDKSISINTFGFGSDTRRRFIREIGNIKEKIDFASINNKIWDTLFSFKYPASACAHELEHARRKSAHDGAEGHNSTKESLWEGDIPRERNYDKSTNEVFQHIILHGFYDLLYERYKEAGLFDVNNDDDMFSFY